MLGSSNPKAKNHMLSGLLGELSKFTYNSAPRPVQEIADASAIALLSGITGRAFNTFTGAGCNRYMLMLAPTGSGKEAIHDSSSAIMAAAKKTVPLITSFRGGGEYISTPGLIRSLQKKPCQIMHLGECSMWFQIATARNAPPAEKSKVRTLLQLYNKSGSGSVFDGSNYSDTEKNIDPILSPSLTIIGEGTPESFWQSLTPETITSGLLSRWDIFEYHGDRPYSRAEINKVPDPLTVKKFADLAALCLGIMQTGQAMAVQADGTAHTILLNYDDETTDKINASGEGVSKHLWNRSHLKVLKLATLSAISRATISDFVSDNPASFRPIVCMEDALWAISIVDAQTQQVIDKFERNEVGLLDGNETAQLNELRRVIREYVVATPGKYESSGCNYEMHCAHIFTQGYLSRRLIKLPTFSNDRVGGTNALKRCIKELLENDEIRRINPQVMGAQYRTAALAFGLTHENQFLKGVP